MKIRCAVIGILLASVSLVSAQAQDQTIPGAGNQNAINLAKKSPLVQSAFRFLVDQAARLSDARLRKETLDAITNPETCIQHRAGLTDAAKNSIIQNLIQAGLVNVSDGASFPGGLKAGVFPPVLAEGSACPHLPQSFFSAPCSAFMAIIRILAACPFMSQTMTLRM